MDWLDLLAVRGLSLLMAAIYYTETVHTYLVRADLPYLQSL